MIPKGTIVEIAGLTSEKGKALNGGYGIIAGKSNEVSGALRYPVLIYALLNKGGADSKHELVAPSAIAQKGEYQKSVKGDNLQILSDQKQELLKEAIMGQVKHSHQHNSQPEALIWFEAFHDRWPEDDELGVLLTYVLLLKGYVKDYKKALDVILKLKDRVDPEIPQYDSMLEMYVGICCDAGERIQDALDHALKIKSPSPKAMSAFISLLAYSSRLNEEDPLQENPEMFDIQLQASINIHQLDPNFQNTMNLGAAHCMNGNNVEGCKFYRKALELSSTQGETIAPNQVKYLKGSLIGAQLQCPGMPLEDYIIVCDDGNVATCIKKADKENVKINRTITGFGTQNGGIEVTGGKEVDIIQFPLPQNPDDPKMFPKSFTDTLKPDN